MHILHVLTREHISWPWLHLCLSCSQIRICFWLNNKVNNNKIIKIWIDRPFARRSVAWTRIFDITNIPSTFMNHSLCSQTFNQLLICSSGAPSPLLSPALTPSSCPVKPWASVNLQRYSSVVLANELITLTLAQSDGCYTEDVGSGVM